MILKQGLEIELIKSKLCPLTLVVQLFIAFNVFNKLCVMIVLKLQRK